ncbi:MAG: hypothetical protein KatS3mg118_3673 [Paracoccaceae bacterium]|nr:MAG: hypothetical protein KatS3mg118_3673 [Paracoccaceae bacterium]
MRTIPIVAILMTTAFAAAAPAAPAQPILLAQADSGTDDPLAPFLKRSRPAPAESAEPPAAAEAPAPPAAEAPAPPAAAEAPAPEPAPRADQAISDLPRKTLPRAEPPRTAEAPPGPAPAPRAAEPQPTSLATISPNRLHEIIRDRVDSVDVDPSGGDTTLEGVLDGTRFQVYFYECDGGDMSSVARPDSECLGFEWRSYFFDYRATPQDVNAWNANYHYGKLFIDSDGDLAVQLNVIVEGGVEEANILTTLAWFRAVLDSVHDYYGR